MNTLTLLQNQLGPLGIPLLLCSLLTLMILLERLFILSTYTLQGTLRQRGLSLLAQHSSSTKSLREEIAAVWLQGQQRKLASGIRLLQIMALIAPLLGLLGTVIGLIQVFETLGDHHGPVEPAMLAEGLGIAMKTTAAGLIIAVPAVLGAHGFQLWVDRLTASTEQALNVNSLQMEGICTKALA